MSLALKIEKGTTSQGMWEVSRISKRQEIDSPPRPTEGRTALQTPGVKLCETHVGFLIYKSVRQYVYIVLATIFLVICYSSDKR